MKKDRLNELLILLYTGSISSNEEQELKDLIAGDEKMLQDIADSRFVDDIMFHHTSDEATTELKSIYKNYYASKHAQDLKSTLSKLSSKPKSYKLYYKIAAAVLVIAVSIAFLRYNNSQSGPEDLSYDDLPTLVVRSNSDVALGRIEEAFIEKKYAQVLKLTENPKLLDSTPSLYLYRSLALSETKRYDEALELINEFINSDYLDAPKGYWYKALILIQKGEKDSAVATLQEIVNNEYPNYNKATRLLNKL